MSFQWKAIKNEGRKRGAQHGENRQGILGYEAGLRLEAGINFPEAESEALESWAPRERKMWRLTAMRNLRLPMTNTFDRIAFLRKF